MRLNIIDIKNKLLSGESVVVRSDAVEKDMKLIHDYYRNTTNPPPEILTYLQENEEVNPFELIKIYIKILTSNGTLTKLEVIDSELVKISL